MLDTGAKRCQASSSVVAAKKPGCRTNDRWQRGKFGLDFIRIGSPSDTGGRFRFGSEHPPPPHVTPLPEGGSPIPEAFGRASGFSR